MLCGQYSCWFGAMTGEKRGALSAGIPGMEAIMYLKTNVRRKKRAHPCTRTNRRPSRFRGARQLSGIKQARSEEGFNLCYHPASNGGP
jgi:hypothetical protein